MDELRIEVSINPCRGKGNARIAFNLINTNTKTLTNAIVMFKEFFNSIDYAVDGISFNIDKSFIEIMLNFSSKQQVKRGSVPSRLKFITITNDEGGK